jgi:HK97 family phage major capsid protein
MKLSEILRAQLDSKIAERDAILKDATPESFTPEVEARTKTITDEVGALIVRREEVLEQEAREAKAAEVRALTTPVAPTATVTVTAEPNPVYRKDNTGTSYFRDLFSVQTNQAESTEARGRLAKSQETRALSTTANAGGQFAPPAWLVDEYVGLARAARVTADLVQHESLPGGVSSINIPTLSGGTATAVTATQNSAVQNTDATTSSVSSNITTIAGQQVVSIQLLRQSAVPFDRIILEDLALDYATKLDLQVINGSNSSGQLKGLITAGTTVTFTSASPAFSTSTAANSLYNKIMAAQAGVWNTRYLPADAIVMTPTRWAWAAEALDSSNRPLVSLNGPVFNQPALNGENVAQGYTGTIAGLPVYVDPNIPGNLGAGTNQDVVFVLRRGDHWLYETPVEQSTWEATYANQNSVLFRVLGFSAFLTRYAASAQVIAGTGTIVPTL